MAYRINKINNITFDDYNSALLYLPRLREGKFKDFLGVVNEMYPNEKKADKEALTNKLVKNWLENVKIIHCEVSK